MRDIMRARPYYMYPICFGFLGRVAGWYSGYMIVCFIFSLSFCFILIEKARVGATVRFFVVPLFFAASFFGASLWVAHYEKIHESRFPKECIGRKISLVAVIDDDPDRGLDKTSVILRPVAFHTDGNGLCQGNLRVPGRIAASLESAEDFSYGDQILAEGILSYPENFTTDTGRTFDYVNYLAMHDVYLQVDRPFLQKLSSADVKFFPTVSAGASILFRVRKFLYAIKYSFVETLVRVFPSPEAGLLAGIIIGEKSLLPKDVQKDFQYAGLTHMIVLSGYNITIVVMSMMAAFAYAGFGYRARRIGAFGVVPLFVVMTGTGASSVRAGIMSMIVLLLQISTRPNHGDRIILFSLTAMVFANPRILVRDPSLHLSFLAFIAVVTVVPVVHEWLEKHTKNSGRWDGWFGVRDLVIETLSVQFFVLPYILWMSGTVSLLILFANIATVPLVPFLMAGGFASVVLGVVAVSLGLASSGLVTLGLRFIIAVAHKIAGVSWAIVTVPSFGAWWVLAFYVLAGLFLWYTVGTARHGS